MTISLRLPDSSVGADPDSRSGARPGRPKYLAIADAVEAAIRDGELGPDDPLPTQRDLAAEMGVTVGTVTRGYAEAARRGLVRGETGRGTFVTSQGGGFASVARIKAGVDLGLTAPLRSMSPQLGRTLVELASWPGLGVLLGRPEPRGLARHRRAGARWASLHGLEADPADVLVCAGAQHAITVCMAALFAPGDKVAVESLAYPQIRPVAKRLRLELVPLAMDEQGILPQALDSACVRENVRGLYATPSCQNPTLARMGGLRRQEVAEVCRRFGVRIVEDDVYRLMAETTLPPLSRLVPELGCFIASTSKVLADGLRVAFLCAPTDDVKRLEAAVEATVWVAAPLMAEVASRWIMDGTAERAVAANRVEAAARARVAAEILAEHPIRTSPAAGFAWLPLPRGWRSVEFAQAAAERGVSVAHMEHFAVGVSQPEQGVRLSLCGAPDRATLRAGLKTLAGLLRW